jgi:hypothetical protein
MTSKHITFDVLMSRIESPLRAGSKSDSTAPRANFYCTKACGWLEGRIPFVCDLGLEKTRAKGAVQRLPPMKQVMRAAVVSHCKRFFEMFP